MNRPHSKVVGRARGLFFGASHSLFTSISRPSGYDCWSLGWGEWTIAWAAEEVSLLAGVLVALWNAREGADSHNAFSSCVSLLRVRGEEASIGAERDVTAASPCPSLTSTAARSVHT